MLYYASVICIEQYRTTAGCACPVRAAQRRSKHRPQSFARGPAAPQAQAPVLRTRPSAAARPLTCASSGYARTGPGPALAARRRCAPRPRSGLAARRRRMPRPSCARNPAVPPGPCPARARCARGQRRTSVRAPALNSTGAAPARAQAPVTTGPGPARAARSAQARPAGCSGCRVPTRTSGPAARRGGDRRGSTVTEPRPAAARFGRPGAARRWRRSGAPAARRLGATWRAKR